MASPSKSCSFPIGKALPSIFLFVALTLTLTLTLALTTTTTTRICQGLQPTAASRRLLHQTQSYYHSKTISRGSCLFLSAEDDYSEPEQSAESENESESKSSNADDDGRIDVSVDDRLFRTRLSRAPGIDWGTDLSFSFVYVREMEPSGEASLMGMVNKNDQLCEMIPVVYDNDAPKPEPVNLLGASFDFVMTAFASMERTVSEMDLVFFRGTKDELKALCNGEAAKTEADDTVIITVIQNKGSPEEKLLRLRAPAGVNVRQYLVDNGINVYQSVSRWTNCKGKQLCGTCIVNVADGLPNTNWKSMDEASTLRSNPDSYRLSCVTFAHGDVTVETFPPVNADQWTR
jgi:ferredoxin